MRNKFIAGITAAALSFGAMASPIAGSMNIFSAGTAGEKTNINAEDLRATRSFLLNEGYAGVGDPDDLNGDGVVDVFDLVTARQQFEQGGGVSLTYFETDISDIHIEQEETVTFTVEVESLKPLADKELAVYDENDKLVTYMHDDGEDGDWEAEDGIYSGQAVLSSPERKLVNYYAATDKVKTDTKRISFWNEFSDEEIEAYNVSENNISNLSFDDAIDYLKKSDDVSYVSHNSDKTMIYYQYNSGITCVKSYEDNQDRNGAGVQITEPMDLNDYYYDTDHRSYVTFDNKTSSGKTTFKEDIYTKAEEVFNNDLIEPAFPEKKKVVVIQPYRTVRSGNEWKNFIFHDQDDYFVIGDAIAKALGGEDCTAEIIADNDVTIEKLRELDDPEIGVFIINTHGLIISDVAGKLDKNSSEWAEMRPGATMFDTGISSDNYLSNSENIADVVSIYQDINAQRIVISEDKLWVTSLFFDEHFHRENIEDSLWISSSCYGMWKNITDSWSEVGFDDSVLTTYATQTCVEIVNRMLFENEYNTVGEAVSEAKQIFGDTDGSEEQARLINKGSSAYKLLNYNGNLTGRVLECDTQKPVFDLEKNSQLVQAHVDIYRDVDSDGELDYIDSADCDENGYYEIGLPIGEYDRWGNLLYNYDYTVIGRMGSDGYQDKPYSTDYYDVDDDDYPGGIKNPISNVHVYEGIKISCSPEMMFRYGLLDYDVLTNNSDGEYEVVSHSQFSIFDHKAEDGDEPFQFIASASERNVRVPTFGSLSMPYWVQGHTANVITWYSDLLDITITRGKKTIVQPKVTIDYDEDYGTGMGGGNVGGFEPGMS